jgi:Immunoglobulin I-set domain
MKLIKIVVQNRQIDGIAPTFAKKPAIRQEEDGKRLLFECRIQADPKPTVTWFHGGVLVQDSARHHVSNIFSQSTEFFLVKF